MVKIMENHIFKRMIGGYHYFWRATHVSFLGSKVDIVSIDFVHFHLISEGEGSSMSHGSVRVRCEMVRYVKGLIRGPWDPSQRSHHRRLLKGLYKSISGGAIFMFHALFFGRTRKNRTTAPTKNR